MDTITLAQRGRAALILKGCLDDTSGFYLIHVLGGPCDIFVFRRTLPADHPIAPEGIEVMAATTRLWNRHIIAAEEMHSARFPQALIDDSIANCVAMVIHRSVH